MEGLSQSSRGEAYMLFQDARDDLVKQESLLSALFLVPDGLRPDSVFAQENGQC